ncbi:LD-carboxypeptidase, partial [Carnobacterium sp.]|uniref:LD-carboxypeptidase n=1 Tax=Carnobacterium sp. TaxID=48221 RepID=UPI0028AAD018
ASTIYQKNSTIFSGTAQERGKALMTLYNDSEIKMIFDLSGGEVANEVLPYLDYTSIKYAKKTFVGYSDLTVMLNAIYAQTDCVGYNFQLLTILEGQKQKEQFRKAFIDEQPLFFLRYEWLTPPVSFSKPVIGGNIRCFLKLAD